MIFVGIYIRLKGSAFVQWKQGYVSIFMIIFFSFCDVFILFHSQGKRILTGQETYLEELKYFVGGPRGEYSFQYVL